jgi:hypothetical protein
MSSYSKKLTECITQEDFEGMILPELDEIS